MNARPSYRSLFSDSGILYSREQSDASSGQPGFSPAGRAQVKRAGTTESIPTAGNTSDLPGSSPRPDYALDLPGEPDECFDALVAPAAPPARQPSAPETDWRAVWQKALGELQLQLAASTYYTWLHDTWLEAYEDGEFIVGTANTYARDWLENRLRNLVRKTLKGLVGRTVDVRFVVRPRVVQDPPNARPAPLYSQTPAADSPTVRSEAQAAPVPAAPMRRLPNAAGPLNPTYTFESFIVGNNNRFATAAAQAVAEKPGYKFNPLFIHGGVGLGKTHLLHSIANALHGRGYNVLYCSSEQFMNDLISAIRNQNTEAFRNKYRELDALLIDDIQFIAGKESTQEEFFHTFNHLQSAGKQIVLSSDRPPKALQSLEERLRSRFEGGIQVDVSAPDFETRVAILQSKAARMGIMVSPDVLKLVAERVDSNIRELEGALNHLFLQAQMAHSVLDLSLANYTLNNVAPQRKPCSPPKLVEIVARHYQLAPDELAGQRRTRAVADARHIAMYLLREDLALSLPQIGQLLGGRDHTTVAHGVEKITSELRTNEQLRRDVAQLREKVYTPFAG